MLRIGSFFYGMLFVVTYPMFHHFSNSSVRYHKCAFVPCMILAIIMRK